jgi:hypothetical protein
MWAIDLSEALQLGVAVISHLLPACIFLHEHIASPHLHSMAKRTVRQILNEQTQSLLFKLPEELRLLIYEEVLGNRLIHIVRRDHKLGHMLCRSGGDQDACNEVKCRGIKLPTGMFVQPGFGHGDLIPLLQSSRNV